MKKRSPNLRGLLAAALTLCPFLLGAVLMPFGVWVDVLALFPLMLLAACVSFNVIKSWGVFLLLQMVQMFCGLGYSVLYGCSYSLYFIGEWVMADVAVFGAVIVTVLTVLSAIPLAAAKAFCKSTNARSAVTVVLLSVAGFMLLPVLLIGYIWVHTLIHDGLDNLKELIFRVETVGFVKAHFLGFII